MIALNALCKCSNISIRHPWNLVSLVTANVFDRVQRTRSEKQQPLEQWRNCRECQILNTSRLVWKIGILLLTVYGSGSFRKPETVNGNVAGRKCI